MSNDAMHKARDALDKVSGYLGLEKLEEVSQLKVVADKLQVKVATLAMGGLVLAVLLVVLNMGAMLVTSIVGFLYPAYMSFKALETGCSKEHTQWLTYWLVTSALNIFLFVLTYIPYWFIIHLAFIVYLQHPQTQGATVIYNKVLRNFLKKYESRIDEKIKEGVNFVEDNVKNVAMTDSNNWSSNN